MERTLVIIKPDAIDRGLAGETIVRIERKGLQLLGCKMVWLNADTLREHYGHLATKPFYGRIAEFMMSSPVIILCWQGLEAVQVVRAVCGVTNGRAAAPGTIRGDYSMSVQCNLVHASDTVEAAETEIARFFRPEELCEYPLRSRGSLYSIDEA